MAHRKKPALRGHGSIRARRQWEAEHKKGGIGYQSKQDKEDAKKEKETAALSKIKGKTLKDPGPGVGRDGKKRTASLKEDQEKNKPKNTEKLKAKPYVDPDAADKKAEKVFRSSSSVKKAKETHAKNEAVAKAKKEKTAKEAAAKKEAKDRKDWLDKTRNSPAARSGAFSDKERWEQQKKHRQWKADRKSGKLKKERKKKERLRIASPMDMD